MDRDKALEFLRQGLSRISYWDGKTCACEHCPSCEARALLILLETDGDLGRALSSPDCACRGEEPIAVVHGGTREDELEDLQYDIKDLLLYNSQVDNLQSYGEKCHRLRVIILEGKPCS